MMIIFLLMMMCLLPLLLLLLLLLLLMFIIDGLRNIVKILLPGVRFFPLHVAIVEATALVGWSTSPSVCTVKKKVK